MFTTSTSGIKLVFLDIGGVILEIDWARALRPLGIADPKEQALILDRIRDWNGLHDFERGQIPRERFFQGMQEILGVGTQDGLEEAWNALVAGPLPGAEKIFDRFKDRIPLVALSNTNREHHIYFAREFPVISRFDHVLTSYELGHRKPDPEIYLAAAEAMGVRPEEAIFIDDSLANVQAALGLGFRAFQTVDSPELTIAVLERELRLQTV